VRLPQVLKVELLGQLDHPGRGADVEGSGTLTLSLQGVPETVAEFAISHLKTDYHSFSHNLFSKIFCLMIKLHVQINQTI